VVVQRASRGDVRKVLAVSRLACDTMLSGLDACIEQACPGRNVPRLYRHIRMSEQVPLPQGKGREKLRVRVLLPRLETMESPEIRWSDTYSGMIDEA